LPSMVDWLVVQKLPMARPMISPAIRAQSNRPCMTH
jgi:hypothetical protein